MSAVRVQKAEVRLRLVRQAHTQDPELSARIPSSVRSTNTHIHRLSFVRQAHSRVGNAKSQHPTYSREAHTVEVEVEKAQEEVRLKIFARYSILPELVHQVQGEICAELTCA